MTQPRVELVTVGETMALMSSTTPGRLRHQRALTLGIGGSESNVAVAASRLGVRAGWIGRVGDDELGQLVVRELLAEGVEVHAAVDDRAPTGLMVKERTTAASGRVWYYRSSSAGSRLSVDDIDRGLVERADLLHITGITFGLSDSARSAVLEAAQWARQSSTMVSLDLNHRRALWAPEEFAECLRPVLASVDLVFGSPHEYAYLVGAGDPAQQLGRMNALGPRQVVLKRGADGACALVDGEFVESPAMAVTVVDTVGAGDAFVAGWLAESLRGAPVDQRMSTAIAAGAFACTVPGDWEGAPSRRDLAELRSGDDAIRR